MASQGGIISYVLPRRFRKSLLLLVLFAVIFFAGNVIFLNRFNSPAAKELEELAEEGTTEENTIKQHPIDYEMLELEKKLKHEQEAMIQKHEKVSKDKDFAVFTENRGPPKVVETQVLKKTVTSPIKKDPVTIKAVESNVNSRRMAVLVIACNRPDAISRCLDKIFQYKPTDANMPVIVSQDCGHGPTSNVIKSYGDKVKHIMQPDLSSVKGVPANMLRFMGYYKISRHYKWALSQAFSDPTIDSVVIVEDDLEIAPDFFEYFIATRPLLDTDPTIFCVSAWNDNGKNDLVSNDNNMLYRSDFFPGLGWLLTRGIWKEFENKWPLGFWDDWIRDPKQRKGRACIRPEISRTKTFGRVGVSQGQFYDQYLQYIKLNSVPYAFKQHSLDYLRKGKYDQIFMEDVSNSPVVNLQEVLDGKHTGRSVRILYTVNGEFEHIAKRLGIMSDLKAGVPRMAYMGVVSIYLNNQRIYIAPKRWNGYNE